MLPEIAGAVETPDLAIVLPFVVTLLFGIIIGMMVEQSRSKKRREAWRERNRWRWKAKRNDGVINGPWLQVPDPIDPKQPDAAAQLRIVMDADFTIQPLLNKYEARVFRELDRFVISCNPDWQVMAQVSLGEVLRCQNADAYGCINSKRVDLLLVDGDCQPRHAIEYQGGAHYQNSAAARDAIKKEALRRAGIGYHEVVAGFTTPSELRRLVEKLVDKPPEPQ